METSTHKLLIPIDVSRLSDLREKIDGICHDHGVASITTRRIVLAIDEALSNIIEHSKVEPGAKIELRVDISPQEITVVLKDSGIAFDPIPRIVEPNLAASPKRGFGLYLIHLIVDELEYQRTNDGQNVLIMTKSLQAEEQG